MEELQHDDVAGMGDPNGDLSEPRRSTICSICGEDTGNFHLNYGASACYSCRAFFRRAIQKDRNPNFACKRGGGCEITTKTRRSCQKCRYDLCLAAGMRSDAVMKDEEKEIRFKKSLTKKRKLEETRSTPGSNEGNSPGSGSNGGGSITEEPRSAAAAESRRRVVRSSGGGGGGGSRRNNRATASTSPSTNSTTSGPDNFGMAPESVPSTSSHNPSYLPPLEVIATGEFVHHGFATAHSVVKKEEPADFHAYPSGFQQQEHNFHPVKQEPCMQDEVFNGGGQCQTSQHSSTHWPANSAPEIKPQQQMLAGPPTSCDMVDFSPGRLTDTLHFVDEMLNQHLSSASSAAIETQAGEIRSESCPSLDEAYLKSAQAKWESARSANDTDPMFLTYLVTFHNGFSILQRSHLRRHVEYITSVFKSFAFLQPEFNRLDLRDQSILLARNAPNFVQYIFGRYLGAPTGQDQLKWLLLGETRLRKKDGTSATVDAGLADYDRVSKLMGLSTGPVGDHASFEIYVSRLNAASEWLKHDATCVVALACLYSWNAFSSLNNPEAVDAALKAAMGEQHGRLVRVIENIEAMASIFCSANFGEDDDTSSSVAQDAYSATATASSKSSWSLPAPQTPRVSDLYNVDEEHWLDTRLREYDVCTRGVAFGEDIITEMAMFSLDVPVSKRFCPCGISVFRVRLL